MAIKVIVFDFDGTLVDSNRLKYDAYFELFPQDEHHYEIIRDVLSESFEESRYVILERILRELGESPNGLKETITILAKRYNDIVIAGVKTCPECQGAKELLQRLYPRYVLYLSSTTPEEALREIVAFRYWTGYFKDIFGYPRKKQETLQEIITKERVYPSQVLVVGDGESDRMSAKETGCDFFCVKNTSLLALELQLG